MKKFSFIGSILLLAVVVIFLFIGCQKESAATDTTEAIATTGGESAVIKSTAGSGINGLISEENATQMAAAYAKSNPVGKTLSVAYATKDLIAYLKVLNNKYKSDSVYVTFAIYDKKTAHKPAQIGRTTVFFMGNKGAGLGKVTTNGLINADDDASSNYLNGGMQRPD